MQLKPNVPGQVLSTEEREARNLRVVREFYKARTEPWYQFVASKVKVMTDREILEISGKGRTETAAADRMWYHLAKIYGTEKHEPMYFEKKTRASVAKLTPESIPQSELLARTTSTKPVEVTTGARTNIVSPSSEGASRDAFLFQDETKPDPRHDPPQF